MQLTVILNWRNPKQTAEAVVALHSWSCLHPRLLVVDNQSTQRSKAILANALKPAELIASDANLGYAGGNNVAIAQALREDAEYVLLLNTDAQVNEMAVASLLRCTEAHPEVAVIGPVLQEGDGASARWHGGGREIARYMRTRVFLAPSKRNGSARYPMSD